jgi:hypothetical protein
MTPASEKLILSRASPPDPLGKPVELVGLVDSHPDKEGAVDLRTVPKTNFIGNGGTEEVVRERGKKALRRMPRKVNRRRIRGTRIRRKSHWSDPVRAGGRVVEALGGSEDGFSNCF